MIILRIFKFRYAYIYLHMYSCPLPNLDKLRSPRIVLVPKDRIRSNQIIFFSTFEILHTFNPKTLSDFKHSIYNQHMKKTLLTEWPS